MDSVLTFNVGGRLAELHLSFLTGRYWLAIDGRKYQLASPWQLSSQFYGLGMTRKWNVSHDGHEIEIEKRKVWLQPQQVTVHVDGRLVTDASPPPTRAPTGAPRPWRGW